MAVQRRSASSGPIRYCASVGTTPVKPPRVQFCRACVSVAGVKQDDIFDGLAISLGGSEPLRYVPGERVGLIFPGKVTLRLPAAEAVELEPFQAPPPVTVWRPSAPSLTTRLSNWLRGKR